MDSLEISWAVQEAQRLRSALRKQENGGNPILMVVTPREREQIWAQLTLQERVRIRLLTSWPWDEPVLVSTKIASAA